MEEKFEKVAGWIVVAAVIYLIAYVFIPVFLKIIGA